MSPSTKLDQAVLWKLKLDTWGLYLDRLMFPSSQKDKNKTAEFVDKHHVTGFKENRKINTIKYIPSFQSSAKLSGGDSSQEWRCSLDTQLFNQLTQKTKKGGGKYRAESRAEDKLYLQFLTTQKNPVPFETQIYPTVVSFRTDYRSSFTTALSGTLSDNNSAPLCTRQAPQLGIEGRFQKGVEQQQGEGGRQPPGSSPACRNLLSLKAWSSSWASPILHSMSQDTRTKPAVSSTCPKKERTMLTTWPCLSTWSWASSQCLTKEHIDKSSVGQLDRRNNIPWSLCSNLPTFELKHAYEVNISI